MYFDAKPITEATGSRALGDPSTMYEVWQSSWASISANDEVLSRNRMLEEAFDARNDAIKRATGEELFNPTRMQAWQRPDWVPPEDQEEFMRRRMGMRQRVQMIDPYAEYETKLKAIGEKYPDLRSVIRADVPVLEDAKRLAREREQKAAETFERYGSGMGKYAAALGAGLGRSFVDPVNLATMAIGPWGTVGVGAKAVLMMAARQGLANAGVEAAMQPWIAAWNKESGVGYDSNKFITNVGTAFLFGAGVDAGIRGLYRGGQRFMGNVPQLDARGGVIGWGPQSAMPTPPGTIVDMPPLPQMPELLARIQSGSLDERVSAMREMVQRVNPELFRELEAGKPEALYKAAEQAGVLDNPEIKGSIDAIVVNGGDPDVIERVRAELKKLGAGVDIDDDARLRHTVQVLRAMHDVDEPMPVALDVVRRVADLSDEVDLPASVRGANQHEGRIEIDGKPVHVRDVDLKTAEIAQEVRGLNRKLDRLQGAWDAEQAGRVVAFQPEKGALQIVDGRARATLAQGVDGDVSVPGIVLREADGWTRAEADMVATMKNLQEGKGDLMETARAFREHDDLADLFDSADDFTAHAKALARLSPAAFERVESGKVNPLMAATIGEFVADTGQHARIMDDLARVGVTDMDEARRLLPYLTDPGDAPLRANNALLGVDAEPRERDLKAGGEVEEPNSPTAKKQLDELVQEMAPEIAEAKKFAAQAQAARDRVIDLQTEIKAREAELKGPPTEFIDPISGEPLTPQMVDDIVAQWEFVREVRNERRPQSLTEFVRSHGGVEDEGGDVTSLLGGFKGRPGVARKPTEGGGMFGPGEGSDKGLDAWTNRAWEAGYFPGRQERPEINDFLEALDQDANTDVKVYSDFDRDQVARIEEADAIREQLADMGVDGLRSEKQIRDHFAEASRVQRRAELEELRRDLADALRLEAVSQGRMTEAEAAAQKFIQRGEDVRKALDEVGALRPDGVTVRQFASVNALPAEMQADITNANVGAFLQAWNGLRLATNPEARASAYAEMQRASKLQSVEGFLSEHGDTIFIADFALDPKGVFAHETVHALRRQGRMTDGELKLLADLAREKGVFDATKESLYRAEYEQRGGNVQSLLDEEAAAHLIQARYAGEDVGPRGNRIIDRIRLFFTRLGNALRGYGFKTTDDVVQAIVSGDMAKRAVTKAQMAAADIKAMAMKSADGNSIRYSFVGPRALTADMAKFATAQEMEAKGATREAIWQKTGWFRGVDKGWRFEISDHSAKYLPREARAKFAKMVGATDQQLDEMGYVAKVGDVYDHPPLFFSYPDLARVGWAAVPGEQMSIPNSFGVWRSDANMMETNLAVVETREGLLTLAHELQHSIQGIEGFAKGGNPRMFSPEQIAGERRRMDAGNALLPPEKRVAVDVLSDDDLAGFLYLRLAGENEARAVEKRMNMTPAERKKRPPWLDYPIAEEFQIVQSGDISASLDRSLARKFWDDVKRHDEELGKRHHPWGRAVDMWVGYPHNAIDLGITGGPMIPEPLERLDRASAEEMARPIRDALRATFGDTITVYRGEKAGGMQSTGRQNRLVSYTMDRRVAENFAGVKKGATPQVLISNDDLARLQRVLDETGEVKIGPYTYRQNGDYIDIYNGDEFVTDTASLADEVRGMNERAAEANAEMESAKSGVRKVRIPVDAVIWATNRGNQEEIIARVGHEMPDGPAFSIRGIAPEPEAPENPKATVRERVGGFVDAFLTLRDQADKLGVAPDDLAGLVSRNPETAPLAARLDEARNQLVEALGPERATALTEMIVRALPMLPDVKRERVLAMLDGVLDQIMPDAPEPKLQMPDPPPPLIREMADMQRLQEAGATAMACRA